jgi:hypothetical protein
MPPRSTNKDDRIFVRDGRRLYRRSFSTTEPLVGIAVIVVLAAVLSWVAWKGAHPNPNLFMLEADLAQAGVAGVVVAPDRGPVPEQLAAPGWVEGDISQFDSENLYEKIDGRESFYKSFGFEMLYFTTVTNEENEQIVIDMELYDLGNSANAMGAYSGERSPDATPEVGESGLMHIHRNALMMTQGRFYLRALGSEESSTVRTQLEHIRDRFTSELPREPLPWGYALLAGRMGMSAASVSYIRENAFSFGFARNVYSATLDDGETELFVSPAEDESTAAELASHYREGFLRYGTAEGDFIKDRYVGTYAFAMSAGPWVVGFRRAEDPDETRQKVTGLAEIVRDFPMPEPASPVEPDTPESVEDSYESYE